MNMPNWQTQIEEAMARQLIFELAILLIVLIGSCWITYWIIKCAIRDGIRESGLVGSWERTVANAKEPSGLPEIKH